MTPLKYITESKIASTTEILAFKREDARGFENLMRWAIEEMEHNGIKVENAQGQSIPQVSK